MTVKYIGIYDALGAVLFTFNEPIIWGDGTTDIPTDSLSVSYDCPFPDDEEETFEKGRILSFGVCFGLAIVVAGITFFIWHRWWR